MFLRDSELKNTAERVCNGYSKLTNVDEGQGGSKLSDLNLHLNLNLNLHTHTHTHIRAHTNAFLA